MEYIRYLLQAEMFGVLDIAPYRRYRTTHTRRRPFSSLASLLALLSFPLVFSICRIFWYLVRFFLQVIHEHQIHMDDLRRTRRTGE